MGLIQHAANTITDRVIGAAIEVHRSVGPGLLESTYQVCLSRELELRGVVHQREVVLPLQYKGVTLDKAYVIDLLVEDSVIVELKSVATLLPIHEAQILTYLKLKRIPVGLLINFNVKVLHEGLKRFLQ